MDSRSRDPRGGAGLAVVGTPHRLTTGGADADLDARLSAELDAHDHPAAGAVPLELSVRVADDAGDLVAGLSGWTWGTRAGWSMVWVREADRGAGWGAQLLEAAEDVARDRACGRAFVSSFSFQAPDFYVRHGYRECARVEDYPVAGAADVYLVKEL